MMEWYLVRFFYIQQTNSYLLGLNFAEISETEPSELSDLLDELDGPLWSLTDSNRCRWSRLPTSRKYVHHFDHFGSQQQTATYDERTSRRVHATGSRQTSCSERKLLLSFVCSQLL
uniref:Uncharacterized protein n=1 Tax=Anopheles coluzzii TaxID=1518534 RepID=A0A8W7PFX3_ANOCL